MYVRKLHSTIIREFAGGGQVINVETGEDCIINDTGMLFLSFITEQAQSIDVIVQYLYNYFGQVELNVIKNDLCEFLTQMEEHKFVITSSKPKEIRENVLDSLHIDITWECNERCIHCYVPNSVKNHTTCMPLKKFCQTVDEFVEMGGKDIVLSGGEPLMHPSFEEMLHYCGEKGLTTAIFSNLTLLDNRLAEVMKSTNVGLVQVSVYSVNPDIHDSITKRSGSLVKTLLAIELLQAEGIPVQISCPIMRQNMNEVVNVMKYARKNGIRLRTNSLITPTTNGDDSFVKSSALSMEEKECMLCDLMDADMTYTRDVLLKRNTNSKELYSDPKGFLKSSICRACINSCSISVEGDVSPCPNWQSYHLGNIYKNTLVEIWYNNPLAAMIRRINRQDSFPECLSCKAIDYCKRCLRLNEYANQGELLRVDRENCDYAWMTKRILEKYDY